MTDNPIDEEWPCIRGCTYPAVGDEPPKPKPQRHGVFCNSCFYRISHALNTVPDLLMHMRAQIVPRLGADFIPFGSHAKPSGSPAPLQIRPLDDADSLFAKLVSWTEVIGGKTHSPQPSVAVWINLKEVQGFKPVTPETAYQLASQLTEWFHVRIETICNLDIAVEFHNDLCWGWDDAPGVFPLMGRYPMQPRPLREADKRECPVCAEKAVYVQWPVDQTQDVAILCGRCSWVAEPEKYGHYAKLFAS